MSLENLTYNLGIPDNLFIRGDVPMTKEEVRILTLAKARIAADDMVIDIGAGTGSLSVEAARLANRGKVIAVERQPSGIELIKANAVRFKLENIIPVLGEAPAALSGFGQADVILVGGSGGRLIEILTAGDGILKPGGRIIVNAVTVETLNISLNFMGNRPNYSLEAFGAQITRIEPVGRSHMFKALNPIYIVVCTKGEELE